VFAAVVVVIVVLVAASASRHGRGGRAVAVGALAPDGSYTTVSGAKGTIASLRGQATVLWFVATWCESCQAGTQAMAQAIPTLAADHVRVVELELADDLGQPGPSIARFGQEFAGAAYANPDWTFGVASGELTSTYDHRGYLDIYYLLDPAGRIRHVSGAPASTMDDLLTRAAKLATAT